jgi:hypothetical protein
MVQGDDSEDLIRGNRKYGRDFHFVNQALFAFSANEIPTVGENSDAYVNRIKPFRFNVTFAHREDPTIEAAMMKELPGILNRLIRAYRRRKDRNAWLDTDIATMAEFESASDRVKLWVREEMQIVTEHKGEPVVAGQVLPMHLCHTQKALARMFGESATTTRQPGMGATKLAQRLRKIPGVTDVRQAGTKIRALNIIERDGEPFDDPSGTVAKVADSRPDSGSSQEISTRPENEVARELGESTLKTATFATDSTDDRATATALPFHKPSTLATSVPCPMPGVTGEKITKGARKGKCSHQAELMGQAGKEFYRCPTHGVIEPEKPEDSS